MNKIGIVVIGYKNQKSIIRLLNELNNAEYKKDSPLLIISIDYSGDDKVYTTADEFVWNHGNKIVRKYDKKLGLRNHILKCGNYMQEYDLDALIVFEDDIFPSRDYYIFASSAVEKYCHDDRIAGISLYSWALTRYGQPFEPCSNGLDAYFMQFAQSWGQVWLRDSWKNFTNWYEKNRDSSFNELYLPEYLDKWGDNSWLKYHIRYCIDNNKFFVIPYSARATCFSEVGEHTGKMTNLNQVVLEQGIQEEYKFSDLDDANVIYDAFFEFMFPSELFGIKTSELTVDLYQTKRLVSTRYLLTTRIMEYSIIKSWGNNLIPHEMNVLKNIYGNDIFLYDREICKDEELVVSSTPNYSQLRFRILENWLWMLENNKTLKLCSALAGINRIAIYGYGVMGKHLYSMLMNADFDYICGIENKETRVLNGTQIYNIDELPGNIDIIIVSVLEEYSLIKKELNQKYDIPIVSVADIRLDNNI